MYQYPPFLDSYNNKTIWWVFISLGLLVSINWWYWTMRSIATLLRSIYTEYTILNEITVDIEELKDVMRNEFRKL